MLNLFYPFVDKQQTNLNFGTLEINVGKLSENVETSEEILRSDPALPMNLIIRIRLELSQRKKQKTSNQETRKPKQKMGKRNHKIGIQIEIEGKIEKENTQIRTEKHLN